MRAVALQGMPSPQMGDDAFRSYVANALNALADASIDEIAVMAKDYTITNYVVTRSLDASTATASDIANFLCTFILDMQKGGSKRTE